MVAERAVLLAVQDLQQRRRRVALVIGAHLVDLVQEHQRIAGTGLQNAVDNPARHGADIRFPVAADVGFVVDAAEGNPGQLPVQALGDGHGDGRFTGAGGAHQTDDLSRQLRGHLLDGQHLQNPLLHLIQAEMVVVQQLFGRLHVHPLLGALVPGQLQADVQIVADDGGLRRAAGLTGQPLDLLVELLVHLFRQLEGLNALLVLENLAVLVVPQLPPQDLHLLPDIVFLLTAVDALLDLLLELVFQPQNFDFLGQHGADDGGPLGGDQLFQNPLLVAVGDGGVLGGKVRHIAQILRGKHLMEPLLDRLGRQLQELVKQLQALAQQRFAADGVGVVLAVGQQLHPAPEKGLLLNPLGHMGPVFALHQNAHRVAGQLQDLADMGHGADLVEVVHTRLVGGHVLLGNQENLLVGPHGLVHGPDGLFAAHVKVDQHFGKYTQSAQRQHRQPLRQDDIVHGYTLLSGESSAEIDKRGPFGPLLWQVLGRRGVLRRACAELGAHGPITTRRQSRPPAARPARPGTPGAWRRCGRCPPSPEPV